MRKLASIAAVAATAPIPDSDRLDMVTLEGKAWRIVTARNEFRTGDRAVYFEIDSALPADDERYAFLRKRCLRTWSDKHGNPLKQAIRIRTVKLRGVISQGLVMPVAAFPELDGRTSSTTCTRFRPTWTRRTASEPWCGSHSDAASSASQTARNGGLWAM